MKTKKLKRFVCLLLAVVVLLAMPLNTQAHAAVAVPWVMYAIITGLAAMGITFTVAGGVDAMIDAVEQKVNEYQTQTGIQLPIIILENTRIEPPSQPPSGWNKNKGYFFLAFNAAMALTAFADWLVNDGGWSEGETINSDLFNYYLEISQTQDNFYPQLVGSYNFNNGNFLQNYNQGYQLPVNNVTTHTFETIGYIRALEGNLYRIKIRFPNNTMEVSVDNGTSVIMSASRNLTTYNFEPYDVISVGFYYKPTDNVLPLSIAIGVLLEDGRVITCGENRTAFEQDYFKVDSTLEVQMPERIIEFSVTEQEGVLLETGATAAETLEELGELFETVFTDTGTIPQPQPQVITDPATEPVPTPAPTAPPIQDVDDLGLPTLGEAVFNKFPFSLPRDLKRIAEILNAEPVTPYWEVDLFAPLADDISFAGDTTLRIDLSEYEALGQISRWASVIGFCIMLIIITKGVIKW